MFFNDVFFFFFVGGRKLGLRPRGLLDRALVRQVSQSTGSISRGMCRRFATLFGFFLFKLQVLGNARVGCYTLPSARSTKQRIWLDNSSPPSNPSTPCTVLVDGAGSEEELLDS